MSDLFGEALATSEEKPILWEDRATALALLELRTLTGAEREALEPIANRGEGNVARLREIEGLHRFELLEATK